MSRHDKYFRYMLGGLFGMTGEYLLRVEVNPWALIVFVCFGLYMLIDIVKK